MLCAQGWKAWPTCSKRAGIGDTAPPHGLGVQDYHAVVTREVARLSGEARNPGAKLRMPGIGLLVCPLLGVVFFG